MLFLFAVSPFLVLLILMAVFNKPAYVAAPITAFLLSLGSYFIWGMPLNWISAAYVKGLGVTLDIMLIIFGAVFLVAVLKQLKLFAPMEHMFANVSKDKRIQAIIVAWFFIGFVEGIAGFGTPALLAIPILLALGFTPFTSVVMALVGDSLPVVFGAVGVPISIGIAEGVGLNQSADLLAMQVGVFASVINLLVAWLIPVMISCVVSKEITGSYKEGFEIWPFAIFSGTIFMLISYLAATFIGAEFPSILGGLLGGLIAIFLLRKGWFVPKKHLTLREYLPESMPDKTVIIKTFLPYLSVLILLLLTRLPELGVRTFLQSQAITLPNILNTSVDFVFNLIYSPGLVFLLTGFAFFYIYRVNEDKLKTIFTEALRRTSLPFVGLFFVLGTVQILILSYYNIYGLPSMPLYIAENLEFAGPFWPLIAPFIGAIGAFMSGSSTVSNLLFSSLQYATANSVGLSVFVILALQAVGSALGNMVAVHNILAAEAVAGLKNYEGHVLRRTFVPVIICATLIGIIGYVYTIIL